MPLNFANGSLSNEQRLLLEPAGLGGELVGHPLNLATPVTRSLRPSRSSRHNGPVNDDAEEKDGGRPLELLRQGALGVQGAVEVNLPPQRLLCAEGAGKVGAPPNHAPVATATNPATKRKRGVVPPVIPVEADHFVEHVTSEIVVVQDGPAHTKRPARAAKKPVEKVAKVNTRHGSRQRPMKVASPSSGESEEDTDQEPDEPSTGFTTNACLICKGRRINVGFVQQFAGQPGANVDILVLAVSGSSKRDSGTCRCCGLALLGFVGFSCITAPDGLSL